MAIPALAAGNGVVLKPPALAPFVALRVAELASLAGFPAGLFSLWCPAKQRRAKAPET